MSIFCTVCEEHSSCRTCDYLVSVKRNNAVITKKSRLLSLVCCSERFSRILNNKRIMCTAYSLDSVHLSGSSVEMCDNYKFNIGIYLKSSFQSFGIHVPGIFFGIDKYCFSALIGNGIYSSIKCNIRTEYFLSFKCSVSRSWLTVKSFTCKFYGKMKCCRSGRKRNGVLASYFFTYKFFCLIDILSDSRHPVGFICFLHVCDLIAVHCGR